MKIKWQEDQKVEKIEKGWKKEQKKNIKQKRLVIA